MGTGPHGIEPPVCATAVQELGASSGIGANKFVRLDPTCGCGGGNEGSSRHLNYFHPRFCFSQLTGDPFGCRGDPKAPVFARAHARVVKKRSSRPWLALRRPR
jgi:hypothetical protein